GGGGLRCTGHIGGPASPQLLGSRQGRGVDARLHPASVVEEVSDVRGQANHGAEGDQADRRQHHDLPSLAGPPVAAALGSRRWEAALPSRLTATRYAPGACWVGCVRRHRRSQIATPVPWDRLGYPTAPAGENPV